MSAVTIDMTVVVTKINLAICWKTRRNNVAKKVMRITSTCRCVVTICVCGQSAGKSSDLTKHSEKYPSRYRQLYRRICRRRRKLQCLSQKEVRLQRKLEIDRVVQYISKRQSYPCMGKAYFGMWNTAGKTGRCCVLRSNKHYFLTRYRYSVLQNVWFPFGIQKE